MVADLSRAQRQGQPIRLEIAVYQYGTDRVSKKKGCLRQIVPFTEDLDAVSAGLSSLVVRGGDEYCGEVIAAALEDLKWSDNPADYKSVFIVVNEPFDQGRRSFGESLPLAKDRAIVVNAVYRGSKYKDDAQWQAAVELAGGAFAKIDHNHRLPAIHTPFDAKGVLRSSVYQMIAPIDQVGEGNCGRATDRGEEARVRANKLAEARQRQPHAKTSRRSPNQ